ncbi:Uncharacterised protein [Chlamydia trachomatis]|nr:Uncharacterised protein [Chlamydia trachomatis]
MQGAEDEGEGSVLTYVTEPEFRKQRSRSPSCNSLLMYRVISPDVFCFDLAMGYLFFFKSTDVVVILSILLSSYDYFYSFDH